MPGLTSINIDPIKDMVERVLRDYPQIAGAFLFGSVLEQCRSDSDIDLGLIPEAGIKPESTEGYRLESDIALALPPVGGHAFDVVLTDPEKPLFAFNVVSGRLIYSKNHERVLDVVEYVSRRYADEYPRYRAALKEVLAEVTPHGH